MRVVPNEQDGVHDGYKRVYDVAQFLRAVRQIQKEVLQGRKIFEVLVRLLLRDLDFFLQLAEWSRVRALVLLKELKNLLDALGVELDADAVEVL